MQEEIQKANVKYLRIKGIVERYSISRSSVYNLIKSGKIRAITVSEGITVYSVEELDALFNGGL